MLKLTKLHEGIKVLNGVKSASSPLHSECILVIGTDSENQ